MKRARTKIQEMEAEPNEETSESTNQGSPEPTQETPESRLRDLRPEKDPMGAGRQRAAKTGAENSGPPGFAR